VLQEVSQAPSCDEEAQTLISPQSTTSLDVKAKKQSSKSKDQKAQVKEFKEISSNLKSQLKPLIGRLNGLIMDDRELDWRGINGDLVDVSLLIQYTG